MCMKKIEKIKIKCNLCRHQFELSVRDAKRIASKLDGFIPCEKCGSHATQWDTEKIK